MPKTLPFHFSFIHGAIDEPDTPPAVFEAIGRVAMAWARLEQHIDAVIMQINKKDHSEQLFREHPVSFSNKVKVLKMWFNKHPPLAAYMVDMRELTRHLSLLSKESRNPLLHSIFSSYDAKRETLHFQSLKYEGNDTIRIREVTIPLRGVQALSDAINSANRFLGKKGQHLFTPDGVERLRKR